MTLNDDCSVVMAEFQPYEHLIRRIIDQAWADYRTIQFRHKFLFVRTREDIIFDLILGSLFQEFHNHPDVTIIYKTKTIKVSINGRISFRIKKGQSFASGFGGDDNRSRRWPG